MATAGQGLAARLSARSSHALQGRPSFAGQTGLLMFSMIPTLVIVQPCDILYFLNVRS